MADRFENFGKSSLDEEIALSVFQSHAAKSSLKLDDRVFSAQQLEMNFLKNLDQDLRESLLVQLRNLWPHASTAIE